MGTGSLPINPWGKESSSKCVDKATPSLIVFYAGKRTIPVINLYPMFTSPRELAMVQIFLLGSMEWFLCLSAASLQTSMGKVEETGILEVVFSIISISMVHRDMIWVEVCCEPAMFLSARSPSHPNSGGAGATPGALHCICGAWEPSSHPSLAAQWPDPPGDRDHPHGVLPTRGSIWGLSALQQTHSLQQWQLHDCGHQPAGLSQPNHQRTFPWKALSR